MSPASAGATLAALEIMVNEPERIKKLWHNAERMREGLQSIGYSTGNSETPILPVYIGDMIKTLELSYGLRQEGVFVNPIVPPGVPKGQELIRISLMATHTDDQIDYALGKLGKFRKKLGIISK